VTDIQTASTTSTLMAVALTKRYGEREVVHDLDFEVHSGEVVGLLGPNGAGKTTTFGMVIGGVLPNSGRVMLDQTEITRLPMQGRARLGITYLPQETSVFRKLTVAQNVMAVLEVVESDRHRRRERLPQLLAELGLSEKSHLRGDSLSGGERRRVEIARALALNPRFILLDEPFSGIDPIAVMDIQKMISELSGRKIGVVITDHNVRETLAICDRAYIIKDGAILRHGSPQEIAEDPLVREIYLGKNFRLE
jgi:lipopolysaccharide export system ATP-binding protein